MTLGRTRCVSVYVVFGTAEEACRIGREMVECRHAACVNILGPCHSVYRWQGAVEEAAEVAAIFKTSEDASENLVAAIAERHSYENPAIVIWSVAGTTTAYEKWVIDSVG
jgi:periplasmic divalent cation tolerance protein